MPYCIALLFVLLYGFVVLLLYCFVACCDNVCVVIKNYCLCCFICSILAPLCCFYLLRCVVDLMFVLLYCFIACIVLLFVLF